MWAAVLIGSAGCYLLKLAGLSLPRKVLDNPRVQHVAMLLPVALLTGLIVIQTFTVGHRVVIDARGGGLAVAFALVLVRAPFLLVVVAACAATALLRLA
jgi:hypothetical protein